MDEMDEVDEIYLGFGHDVSVGGDALEEFTTGEEFEDEDHFIVVLEGVVQVDELGMMQVVHDVDLLADEILLDGLRHRNEFGSEDLASLALAAAMHHAERARSDLFQNLVQVVDARCFDVDRLRHVFGIDVHHEGIVVSDLVLGLATDAFARFIHFKLAFLHLFLA